MVRVSPSHCHSRPYTTLPSPSVLLSAVYHALFSPSLSALLILAGFCPHTNDPLPIYPPHPSLPPSLPISAFLSIGSLVAAADAADATATTATAARAAAAAAAACHCYGPGAAVEPAPLLNLGLSYSVAWSSQSLLRRRSVAWPPQARRLRRRAPTCPVAP